MVTPEKKKQPAVTNELASSSKKQKPSATKGQYLTEEENLNQVKPQVIQEESPMTRGITSGDEPVDLLSSSAYEDEGPIMVLAATTVPSGTKATGRDRTISGSGQKKLET